MADTDQDVNLPNLDPTKVGDEIAKKEGKPAVDKKIEKTEDTKKSEQDKEHKIAEKSEQEKQAKKAQDVKTPDEEKPSNSSQDIEDYEKELEEELGSPEPVESEKEKFDLLKRLEEFDEAITHSKNDPSGFAILKWVRKNIKSINKFPAEARAVIYNKLWAESFVDKSEGGNYFPLFPNDIPPAEQSRLCINAFAQSYLASFDDNVSINDKDILSLDLSYELLTKEKKEKELKSAKSEPIIGENGPIKPDSSLYL
jgi:molecular chaperone GrpE (heat shock protein)